jgi:hypothetical protein
VLVDTAHAVDGDLFHEGLLDHRLLDLVLVHSALRSSRTDEPTVIAARGDSQGVNLRPGRCLTRRSERLWA